MSKITKHLNEWLKNGFINEDQLKSIEAYEAAKQKTPWIFTAILILGAFCIGLGIISVIAANWADILDVVKLTVNFLLLSLSGYLVYTFKIKNKSAYFEAAVILFVIQCLASIGLISQIYHLKGDLFQALGLWLFITAPIAMYSRTVFLPVAWVIGLYMTLVDFFISQNGLDLTSPLSFVMITLIFACLVQASMYLEHRLWSYSYLAGLVLSIIPSIYTLEYFDPYFKHSQFYWFAILALAFIFFGITYKSAANFVQKRINYSVLLTYLLMFLFYLSQVDILIDKPGIHTYGKAEIWQSFLMALFTLAILFQMGLLFISLKMPRIFTWVIALMGLRVFILYVQTLGGLATTGIGLIISGVMVILLALAWTQNKSKLTSRIQGWLLNE